MSKYNADEIERMADWVYSNGFSTGNAVPMLREFARRLRQEEEEMRRDPVVEPRPGDRIECATSTAVWVGKAYPCSEGGLQWQASAIGHSATVIRRREVQQ